MAIPSNAFTTYDAIGNREDLIDVITNISPVDTWFTSRTGNGKATNRYHEFQIDSLASAAANAQIEGNTKTASAITPTTRTGNYTQILSKEFMVTEDQDIFDKAGRNSETEYQTMKHMKELANDIEYALLINASAVSGDTATARQLKGVLGWITTNTYTGTATGNATYVSAANIRGVLQDVWSSGGKPSALLCGGFQKQYISTLTTSATKYVEAVGKEVVDSVSVYDTDFGRVTVNLSHILDGATDATKGTVIAFGDMALWKKAWARPVRKKEMPVAAWAKFFSIEAELTLESRQQAGSGVLKNLRIA